MSLWDRPPHAMTGAFAATDLRIAIISEAERVPAARELFLD